MLRLIARLCVFFCATAICGCGGAGSNGAVPPASSPATRNPVPGPAPLPTATAVPGTASALSGPSFDPHGAWGPPAVATALQFPVQSGFDGTRQTVAILMDAYPRASDYQYYLSYFQVPVTARTIAQVDVSGGPDGTDDTMTEATLDTETVAGLAPGANILIYGYPNNTLQSLNDALNQVLSDRRATVVSYSAGACEKTFASSGMLAGTDTILQQLAQAGIAVVASSGDAGNDCSFGSEHAVGVLYPASDPNVISVGGTETDRTLGFDLTSSTVWSAACSSGPCAGGGGVSAYFALPFYQTAVAGLASRFNRNVPDISMPAEGAAEYVNGAWAWGVVGTSWSAPQYAALLTEVYEYCNAASRSPASIPYAVFAKNAGAFIDVRSGTNEVYGTPFFSATTGFDNASGIGVPLGMSFANTICPSRVAPLAAHQLATVTSLSIHGLSEAYDVDVRPRIRDLMDRGRRSAGENTRVQIVLRSTDTQATDERAVMGALHQAGFTIVRTFGNHLVIDAQAPNATVERYFATEMHYVEQGRYGTRYAPATRVRIPDSLAAFVAAVNLDDVIVFHGQAHGRNTSGIIP